jgi:hypothetical protein
MTISLLAIDLAKQVFQLHGVDRCGAVVLRERLRRHQLLGVVQARPPCTIAMEACRSAHFWGREFARLGHTVKLLPPHYVKPYVKTNKHDAADAEAIAEAYPPPYLYQKARFITEDFPHYAEQVAFEQALAARQLFDFQDGYGPSPQVFDDRLKAARLEVTGFTLKSARSLPSLEEKCGKYFTFRDFIICGETQARTGIPNLPEQAETYNALVQLATLVLDPVIEYFGDIILTYGLCSRALAKQVPGRNAPKLDQHASHELNTHRKPICARLGAAVDFLVTDESMLEVAQWVVKNTPFDRLYFYGDDRPLHVSYGPENKCEIVLMIAKESGRAVPKVVRSETFLHMTA